MKGSHEERPDWVYAILLVGRVLISGAVGAGVAYLVTRCPRD